MSPISAELKIRQAEYEKRMATRGKHKNRIGINVTVKKEIKEAKRIQGQADEFRKESRTDNWLRQWKKKNKKS